MPTRRTSPKPRSSGPGPVAGPGGGERLGGQHHPGGFGDGGDVLVLVGIDATDDDPAGWWDAGHVGPFLRASGQGRRWLAEGGGQDSDGTPLARLSSGHTVDE